MTRIGYFSKYVVGIPSFGLLSLGRKSRTNPYVTSPLNIGVYTPNLPSHEPPAWFVELEDARAWKKAGIAHFINHGRAVRLIEHEDNHEERKAGGTFRSAWRIATSGCIPVWQMRKCRTV